MKAIKKFQYHCGCKGEISIGDGSGWFRFCHDHIDILRKLEKEMEDIQRAGNIIEGNRFYTGKDNATGIKIGK